MAQDIQSQQWYLDAMSADQIWKVSTGKGITVAVVDSGVSETPSLQGRLLPGRDVTPQSGDANDDTSGHGTSMAELIAGSGKGGGIKGLAPGAKIIPYRVSGHSAGESDTKSTDDSEKGIRAAADSDARIINMSFGSPYYYDDVAAAVKYALGKGKLLFAAVGNEGKTKEEYPAALHGVVGVAAVDKNGTVGKFSEHNSTVDLAAPGVEVPTWCDKTLAKYCPDTQGTSQATALASASAALIWSAHPDWTANQVLRVMIDTAGRSWAKNDPSEYLGYGFARPTRNLLHGEGDPGPADVDPITNKKTPTASTATSEPGDASQAPGDKTPSDKSGGQTSAAASDKDDSGGNGQLWTIIGAVAAVVVIGGAVFAFTRRRAG
ncbi:S8 family serine peptidase [Streptomyces odontomachi]|uniref:S8 family serine peptidase n=1 Tax=Streptomyces odontomachi TaxID=2944940 RepID=UPI002109D27F|nr:S8 family serine peptidase [Streptomyces sp. ODS25]